MAVSLLFFCNKIHKDPTLNPGCIKPYVFIGKITTIDENHIFHKGSDPLRTLFFDRDGWGSG